MQIRDIPFQNKPYVSERLLRALDTVFQYPLTVVVAPPNAGKTVAVQEYLRKNHASYMHAYWYAAYGEPLQATWKGLCSIFSKIDGRTAKLLDALDAPVRERLPEIAQCMGEIRCNAPTVLVIDNFQLVQSDASFGFITALAQHGNDQLHIVVITQRLEDDRKTPFGTPRIGRVDAQYFGLQEQEAPDRFSQYGFAPREKEPARRLRYDQSRHGLRLPGMKRTTFLIGSWMSCGRKATPMGR